MARVVGREESPDASELRDGMIALSSLYEGWLTNGMFGRLTDVYQPGDYEAGEGERIYTTGTVTLPDTVDDGERQPRDLVAVEVNDAAGRRAYVWDRTAWAQITGLAEGDEAPLATRSYNGLAACVATVFADEFGAELTNGIVRQASVFKTALSFKMGSERTPSTATYF